MANNLSVYQHTFPRILSSLFAVPGNISKVFFLSLVDSAMKTVQIRPREEMDFPKTITLSMEPGLWLKKSEQKENVLKKTKAELELEETSWYCTTDISLSGMAGKRSPWEHSLPSVLSQLGIELKMLARSIGSSS